MSPESGFIVQRSSFIVPLAFQQVDVFQVDRVARAVDRDDQSQADCGLRGRDRQHEDGEDLARHLLRHDVAVEGHQVDIDCVEQQLDAHQHGDGVAAGQRAVKTDAEQSSAD